MNCNTVPPMRIERVILFFLHILYTHSNQSKRVYSLPLILVLSLLLSCLFVAMIPVGCLCIYTYRYSDLEKRVIRH